MKVLVTGAKGQLGSELHLLQREYSCYSMCFTDVQDCDLTDAAALEHLFSKADFDVVINCAAYTAVDQAEENEAVAKAVNVDAVRNLAQACEKKGIALCHISTDYVFDGTSSVPYREQSKTSPLGVYGKTKLQGEQAVFANMTKSALVLRTSWLYSSFGHNFVKTMLRLGKEREGLQVVYDQVGTPTYARDLAKCILTILPEIASRGVDVYHYSNEGACSWYDFALAIFEIEGLPCKVKPVSSSVYPTKACRPSYSILAKEAIKETFNLEIPHWKDSLGKCLQMMKKEKYVAV